MFSAEMIITLGSLSLAICRVHFSGSLLSLEDNHDANTADSTEHTDGACFNLLKEDRNGSKTRWDSRFGWSGATAGITPTPNLLGPSWNVSQAKPDA